MASFCWSTRWPSRYRARLEYGPRPTASVTSTTTRSPPLRNDVPPPHRQVVTPVRATVPVYGIMRYLTVCYQDIPYSFRGDIVVLEEDRYALEERDRNGPEDRVCGAGEKKGRVDHQIMP